MSQDAAKKTWNLLGLLFCFLMRMPFGPFFLRRFHLRLRVYIICFIFSAFSINTDHENKNRFSSSKCFRFFLATPLCAHLQTEVSAKFILFPWIFFVLCTIFWSIHQSSARFTHGEAGSDSSLRSSGTEVANITRLNPIPTANYDFTPPPSASSY